MTNEEKIKEMFPFYEDMDDYEIVQTIFKRKGAMEMAEWQDSQLKHYLETCLEKAQKRAVDKLVITLEAMIEELGL